MYSLDTSEFQALNSEIKETFEAIERFEWQAITSLRRMRDSEYFREKYETFKDYCQEELREWGGDRRIRQLLAADKVVEALRGTKHEGIITKERQARPLLRLVESQELLEEAIEMAVSSNPHPTGVDFAKAVDIVSPKKLGVTPEPRLGSKTYTEEELQKEVARVEQEVRIGVASSIREEIEEQVREQVQASRALMEEFRAKAIALQQEVDQLQALRQLEAENQSLQQRVQDLERALEERSSQQWGTTFNEQARKALNQQVLEKVQVLESLEPHLHLRVVATSEPLEEDVEEIADLVKQVVKRIKVLGLRQFRDRLDSAKTWSEFESCASRWDFIKHEIWGQLSQVERDKIKFLKEKPQLPIPVGASVAIADPYNVAYSYHGTVEEATPEEVLVRWKERVGQANECNRYSVKELRILEEVCA